MPRQHVRATTHIQSFYRLPKFLQKTVADSIQNWQPAAAHHPEHIASREKDFYQTLPG